MRYDANETIDAAIPTLAVVRSLVVDVPEITATEQYFTVRARLHNLSVKLECLGTNTGLYPPGSAYLGTVPAIETGGYTGLPTGPVGGATTIKKAWAEDSIAVGYLHSVAAAALVDKPVVVHAAIAENISYKTWRDMAIPGSGVDKGALSFSTALEPIVVYVPRAGSGDTAVNYRLVIGQQWCSRHPHNIMLRSTQKQHPATPPHVWHDHVGSVKDVKDILTWTPSLTGTRGGSS